MWLLALVTVYLACGAVLLAVLLQDRAKLLNPARRGRRRRDPRATETPEFVVRTQS